MRGISRYLLLATCLSFPFVAATGCASVERRADANEVTEIPVPASTPQPAALSPDLYTFDGGDFQRTVTMDGHQLSLEADEQQLFPMQGDYRSSVHTADTPFNEFQMQWAENLPERTELQVWARFHEVGGDWTGWQPIRNQVMKVYALRFDQYQYRVRMTSYHPLFTPEISDLHIQKDLFTGMAGEYPVALQDPDDIPSVIRPAIISRRQWGAIAPKGRYDVQHPSSIVIHHTDRPSAANYTGNASARQVQRYHMKNQGWMDVGYHFLIGPDGRIYEGRPAYVVGAHAQPNPGKIGICLIGNFNTGKDKLTAPAHRSLLQLMTYLTNRYQISTREIYGHRDFAERGRLCPGERIYAQIPQMRREVETRLADAALWRTAAEGRTGADTQSRAK